MIRLNTPRVPLAAPCPNATHVLHNHALSIFTNDSKSFSAFIRTKTGRQNVRTRIFPNLLQQKKHFLDTVAHITQVYKYEKILQCLTTRIPGKKEFAGISEKTKSYSNIIEDIYIE